MDRRIIVVAVIASLLICIGAFILSRPITGTWVCTEPLTQSAMLTDEVTTISIHPDGTARFRSYGDYMGRYEISDGYGRWEPAGQDTVSITITQGSRASCTLFANCTFGSLEPSTIAVSHDRIRDTIIYTDAGAPEFSSRWPFVRSVVRDCSGPDGCVGY